MKLGEATDKYIRQLFLASVYSGRCSLLVTSLAWRNSFSSSRMPKKVSLCERSLFVLPLMMAVSNACRARSLMWRIWVNTHSAPNSKPMARAPLPQARRASLIILSFIVWCLLNNSLLPRPSYSGFLVYSLTRAS